MTGPEDAAFADHVRRARIEVLSRQRPATWTGNLALAGIAAYVLWPHHPIGALAAWGLAQIVMAALRLRDWRRLRRQGSPRGAAAVRWLRRFVWMTLLTGAIWAAGAWYFLDRLPFATLAVMLLILAGLVNGAMVALAQHLPAMLCFTVPITGTVAVRLLTLEHANSAVLCVITLAYLVFLVAAGRALAGSVDDMLRLDYEKQALVDRAHEAQSRAEAASAEKSRFLASVSHDLRQPLYAMRLFIESLAARLPDREARAIHRDLARSHHGLEDLITGLLDLSRLDAGQVEVLPADLDLDVLLRNVVSEFAPQARRRGLSLAYEAGGFVVRADPMLLARVLRNLVDNAIKFTAEGEVRIASAERGDRIAVRISDTGPGIPGDEHDAVFSEFYQISRTGRDLDRDRGVGLGLSVVRRLCALLDIRLELHSRAGEGTSFTLLVPPGDRGAIAVPSGLAARDGIAGLHVVVIEDEAPIRRGLRTLLRDHGCLVTTADSGRSALDAVTGATRPPDIVVSDYRLGHGESGIDAIAHLRTAIDPQLPALLISGDTDPATREAARAADIVLLPKPVPPSRLFQAMSRLV